MAVPLNIILNLTEEQIKSRKIELGMKGGRTRKPLINHRLDRPENERLACLAKRYSY